MAENFETKSLPEENINAKCNSAFNDDVDSPASYGIFGLFNEETLDVTIENEITVAKSGTIPRKIGHVIAKTAEAKSYSSEEPSDQSRNHTLNINLENASVLKDQPKAAANVVQAHSAMVKKTVEQITIPRTEATTLPIHNTANLRLTEDTQIAQKSDTQVIVPPAIKSSGDSAGNVGAVANFTADASENESDGSNANSDELRDFFPATREGFIEVAGRVKRVTRADFDDFNRRKHLESFMRSMENWKSFDKNQGIGTSHLNLNFDRYQDIFVYMGTSNMTVLDKFIMELMSSSENVLSNDELTALMSKLRRKYRIAPSKRELFERLQHLQTLSAASKSVPTSDDNDLGVKSLSDGVEQQLYHTKTSQFSVLSPIQAGKLRKVKVETKMQRLLRNKATRSNSGVVVITVMTSPGTFSCSENCYYCPNEPGQPRSYLSTEPAVLRANQNDFDPVRQFYDRAITLFKNGHVIDKIEIIVLGGTWSGYPRNYQEEFVRDLFYAANIFPNPIETARGPLKLEDEQNINETATCRIIGLTLETRPDRITPHEIEVLRKLGCTRVQLGIQHTDDKILQYVNRGHTLNDSIRAIYLLKENCYKVDIHIMPDLPGSDVGKDMEMFSYILGSENLQVDQWKIYPCEVTPFTVIEKWYKDGTYVPYFDIDQNLLKNLIISVKRAVHPWIRLNRVIRDIPNPSIIAGTNITNMRQLLLNDMKKRNISCHCIRCREAKDQAITDDIKLMVREYKTRGGTEYFLSYETSDETKIYGFLRLRLRNNPKFNPNVSTFKCLENCGLIRELHVYGVVVAHGETVGESIPSQHRGIGTSLLLAAEIIAAAKGFWRMAVIAGIGTREYYTKYGYVLQDTFMTKNITTSSMFQRFTAARNAETNLVRVPNSLKIHVIHTRDSVELLKEALPTKDAGMDYTQMIKQFVEYFKKETYNINVLGFLNYSGSRGGKTGDYTKEMFAFTDEVYEYIEKTKRASRGALCFVGDRPLFCASLVFLGVVIAYRLKNRNI